SGTFVEGAIVDAVLAERGQTAAEAIEHAEVRWLLLVVAIEEERVVRALVVDPGVLVRESPERDGLAAGLEDARADDLLEGDALGLPAALRAPRKEHRAGVELADVHAQAQLGEAADVGAQVAFRGIAVDRDVRLKADSVDWNALRQEIAHQRVGEVAL